MLNKLHQKIDLTVKLGIIKAIGKSRQIKKLLASKKRSTHHPIDREKRSASYR